MQDELKQMAEQIVTMMSPSTTADSGQWHASHLSMWNVSRVTTAHNNNIPDLISHAWVKMGHKTNTGYLLVQSQLSVTIQLQPLTCLILSHYCMEIDEDYQSVIECWHCFINWWKVQ